MAEESLTGTVRSEVFRNAEGTFTVLRLDRTGQGHVTVAGPLPPAQAGETLQVWGEWVEDPRYGRQFRASRGQVAPPGSREAVERYLASGALPGVGAELARRIVERFGDDTVQVLDREPARLGEVKGIGRQRLARIRAAWEAQRESREVMLHLRGHGLGPVLAGRIQALYGAETRRVLDEDPYRLAREVDGVGFLTADRLARATGLGLDDPRRLRAGLLHVAQEALERGDTAIPADELLERAASALGVGGEGGASRAGLEEALLRARQELDLELDRVEGDELVYLPRVLRAERGAARCTAAILAGRAPPLEAAMFGADPGPRAPRLLPPIQAERALVWLAEQEQLELSPAQADAIRAMVSAPLTIVTGGPGVGKTTVLRALVRLLRAKRARFALAAPTGRAAKRLEEAAGAPASTLHRLLEWDPRLATFARNAEQPLEVDLLVVDEASMVDVPLYHAVVRALPAGASLVLTGDVDQLPSVGPGAVLGDLIRSGACPVVRLTEVFRQAAASRIVAAAHAINQGLLPDLAPEGESDFFFVERDDAQAARELIVRLVAERIPRRFGLDPLTDVQVLAPMHRGACGTDALNEALRAALCPGQADPGRAGPGDKVMQLRNDYDHDVYNGDVGRVVRREDDGGLVVAFDGREVPFGRADAARLALAYCATIHKAQGSEYPAVVIPVLTEHFVMLERNLLYTALTRARKLAVLVGQRRAVEMAVKNDRPRLRRSFLWRRLLDALER